MPLATVYTSSEITNDDKLKTLQRDVSSTVAKLIGKPEKYVMTCVVPRSRMTLGGSFEPCALVELKSIGGLGGDVPGKITAAICKVVHDAIGVVPNRTYVVFEDVPAQKWGFDGAMFG